MHSKCNDTPKCVLGICYTQGIYIIYINDNDNDNDNENSLLNIIMMIRH